MDSASQVQDSAVNFPSKLPEAALAVLFSKKNIDRIVERSRQFTPKQSSPELTERKPQKRPPDPVEATSPLPQRSVRHFDSSLLSRLTQWESRDRCFTARKSTAREKLPLLYDLHCRVAENGGYFRVLGFDLWHRIEDDLGVDRDTARQTYEDYIAVADSSLHPGPDPNPLYWPLSKLQKAVVVPALCVPESLKTLKKVLVLPCCIFRGDEVQRLPSRRDLQQWAKDTLRLSPVRALSQCLSVSSSESILDNSANYGVPLVCLNSGNCAVTVKVMRSEEREEPVSQYWFVIQDPGDVLFVQGKVKLAVCCGEGSSELTVLPALSQIAGKLMSSLELAKAGTSRGKIELFSLVTELLSTETPLLSLRSRFMLSEQLLEELADWNREETGDDAGARNCSLCSRPLFAVGRKCECGAVLCRMCRLAAPALSPHNCSSPNFSWVRTDSRDLNKTIAALEGIQQQFTFSLAVSSKRIQFVARKPEAEHANGHRS